MHGPLDNTDTDTDTDTNSNADTGTDPYTDASPEIQAPLVLHQLRAAGGS